MKKDYNYHYVYRITNTVTGYHYYGSKSCNETPEENIGIKYFSTSTNKLFIQDQKNNPQDYKYKIIKIFETSRKDATQLEVDLHKKFDVKNHPKFINKANQTSTKFNTTGLPSEKHHMFGKTHSNKAKNRIGNGSRGKTTVKDSNGNSLRVYCDDERIKSGELVGINKGMKFSEEAKKKQSLKRKGVKKSQEHRDKISKSNKGKKFSDTHKQKIRNSKSDNIVIHNKLLQEDKFVKKQNLTNYLNEGWKIGRVFSLPKSKWFKVLIYNANGEIMYSCQNDFKLVCLENNLPFHALYRSYKANGKKLFGTRLPFDKEHHKFKGWYAKVVD